MHGLKTLRDIALDHCAQAQPDLAALARELGREVYRQSTEPDRKPLERKLDSKLDNQRHPRGARRWLLGRRRETNVLVMAWPANYATPVHGYPGLWGLEMILHGALEVQSYQRDDFGQLYPQGTEWLGPGDARWFDADASHVHRCRNLSRQAAAWTLHVYGGDLAKYPALAHVEPSRRRQTAARRNLLAGQPTP